MNKKVLLIVLLVVLFSVGLDRILLFLHEKGSLGLLYSVRAKINGPHAYELLPRNKISRVVANPYMLYVNTPHFTSQYGKQHDENGYRETIQTKSNIKSEAKILAIGGSTTYGAGVYKPEEAWTNVLQDLFLKDNKEVEVINAGLVYATSAELLAKYAFKDQYTDHDVLIIHSGGNDLLPISFPDFREDYSHVRMQAGQSSGYVEKVLLKHSGFFRMAWSIWSKGTNFGMAKWQPFARTEIEPNKFHEYVSDKNRYTSLRNNITSIVRLAKAHDRKVIIMPFINNHYDPAYNSPSLESTKEFVDIYFNNMKTVLENIAKNEGAEFFEITKGDIHQSNFVDNCHLNLNGQKQKALSVYEGIAKIQLNHDNNL